MKEIEEFLGKRFENKKTVLLGAGVSNTPLVEFLTSFGARVEVRDKKSEVELGELAEKMKGLGATLVTGEGYLDAIEADYVFRSPGFRPDSEALVRAKENGAELTSELELFAKICPAFLIGITGSDGKSTTTTVISKMLEKEYEKSGRKVYLGGNIGYPLLNRVCEMDEKDFVSCEMSSFQLMTIDSPVDVAVITNISPNHLNWHVGMEEYIEAKAKILRGAKRAVLNYGNDVTRELGKKCTCPVTYFSKDPIPYEDLEEKDSLITLDGDNIVRFTKKTGEKKIIMKKSEILLPGIHNAENYMSAAGALEGIVPVENIAAVAREFGGVKHRLELIRVKDGIYFYNSSIDSSPTRTAAALSAITDKKINVICGGYDKKIPFEPLAKAIALNGNVKSVTLTGATAEQILSAIDNCAAFDRAKIKVSVEKDFEKAVRCAASNAEQGDAVLLSPACASFDAFPNFEVRGDFFRKIVMEL